MPFLGSPSIQTSTANQQLVPNAPSSWTLGYSFKKFSFANDQDCTITVNTDSPIFLRAGQGFESDKSDTPITSFLIKESGITYNWIGSY
jgi:hypothetical protein